MIDFAAWKRPTAHPFPLPAALEPVLRHYYAGFVWVLCEWLESPSPKSVDAFLADAVASIAAERLVGVLALACFVAGVLLARADFFARDPALAALRRGLLLASGAVVAGTATIAAIDADAPPRRLRPGRDGAAGRAAAAALRVWGAMRLCLRHPRAAGAAFALSILNFATMACCWFALSRAVGMALPLRDLAAATPVADAAAALPVTPSGAGLRENLLQRLLDAADVPRAQSTALGLLMFATILLWALLCGAFALSGRRTAGPAAAKAAAAKAAAAMAAAAMAAAEPPLPRNGRP